MAALECPCFGKQEQEEKATFTEPEVAAPEYVPAVDDAAFAAPAVVPSFEPVAGESASVTGSWFKLLKGVPSSCRRLTRC